jgi:choline dehydrogenase
VENEKPHRGQERDFKADPMAEETAQFDHVIVGAGTAGCVLANRLSRDPGRRVLLVEAGGADDWIWLRIPVGYLFCIGNPRTDWCLSTEPEAGLQGRTIRYPRGRVLGGSSAINGMIYMRGQREDYDGWRAGDGHGANPGWGWDDVLPYFIRHEDYFGGASPWHGAGGELRVEKPRVAWRILDAFRAAAAQCGIPASDDFNRGDNLGCGYFDVTQRRGVRWTAARGFLDPIRDRANLVIWTRTHARSLRFEGRRCTGVELLRDDGSHVFAAARAGVVLAAGAVGSPQLLQRSGIGPAPLLDRFGIAPVQTLAGVGANLQDHLQLRMVFRVRGAATLNTLAANPLAKVGMALQYALRRSGPLAMSPSQLGAFAPSAPEEARPNLAYHVQPLSLERFGEPLDRFPAFTASVCNLRPSSRGTVTIGGADPAALPRIAPNYLSTDRDRQVAVQALRLTRAIAAAPALARFAPQEYRPGVALQTDPELVSAAGAIGTTIFHPVGTAKMGPSSDPFSVVDAELCVHGVAGLRVADASIMPAITSGNTNAPTAMIAERAAELILR